MIKLTRTLLRIFSATFVAYNTVLNIFYVPIGKRNGIKHCVKLRNSIKAVVGYLMTAFVVCNMFLNLFYVSVGNERTIEYMLADNSMDNDTYLLDTKRYYSDHKATWNFKDYVTIQPQNFSNQTNKGYDMRNLKPGALLTLFTTFHMDESRHQINNNTLRLWSLLRPLVQPVLFSTPEMDLNFLALARDLGWFVYPVLRLKNKQPLIRDMFMYLINNSNTSSYYYGYANADIVFTRDLIPTLRDLTHLEWSYLHGQGVLISGRKYKISVERMSRINRLLSRRYSKTAAQILRNKYLGSNHELEYFITTAEGFPFQNIGNVSTATTDFINGLSLKALDWQIRTMDCTKSITALHQTKEEYFPHLLKNTSNIDEKFLQRSATDCFRFIAQNSKRSGHPVIVFERSEFDPKCQNN